MTNLILFDDPIIRTALLPFTFTRPVAKCRVGILTIAEKWGHRLGVTPSYLTVSYLSVLFPQQTGNDNLYVNGALLPTDELVKTINALAIGEALTTADGQLLAIRVTEPQLDTPTVSLAQHVKTTAEAVTMLKGLPDFLENNGKQIRVDFALLTAGRKSQPITDPFTHCYGADNIFIEEGVNRSCVDFECRKRTDLYW